MKKENRILDMQNAKDIMNCKIYEGLEELGFSENEVENVFIDFEIKVPFPKKILIINTDSEFSKIKMNQLENKIKKIARYLKCDERQLTIEIQKALKNTPESEIIDFIHKR